MDEDFLLALQLQEQFDQERPLSIVDESWELLDPNPDVRAMFLAFNDMFFWGKLSGVEVRWSPRMTLCAGLCCYEGRGGLCSIRLSEPLLKLRPRRDLVQTLLHEMIHALLFVTQNNRDRDGHGPEFCKHMDRINKASGTNITVYHTFHDEVDLYRQHWWRCNGPCQNLKPFFGYVKRAMNRAPSAQDPWWADHQQSCGGTYIKIKEPENYGKKDKKDHNKDTKGHTQPANRSKNVLPFSGKGFVLGGNPRPASPEKQPELSNARLPSSTFSGKNHNGPGQASPGKIGGQATVSSGSSGPQNLPKRPNSLNKKSVNTAFTSNSVNLGRAHSNHSSNPADSRPGSGFHSEQIRSPKKPSSTLPISKKRPWEGITSTNICDFFKRKTGVSSGVVDTRETPAPAATCSFSQPALQAAPADTTDPRVRCPVCQIPVPESKINEHLDSCLT
uniref:DNA-dependent metalloprotease SPRTN n=1 Tax=Scleropages formosus TaxID=113540 RepID=A0A8C9RWU1_SCLFO